MELSLRIKAKKVEVDKDRTKVANRLGKIPRAFTPLIMRGCYLLARILLCAINLMENWSHTPHNTNVNNRLFIALVSAIVGRLSSTHFISELQTEITLVRDNMQ